MNPLEKILERLSEVQKSVDDQNSDLSLIQESTRSLATFILFKENIATLNKMFNLAKGNLGEAVLKGRDLILTHVKIIAAYEDANNPTIKMVLTNYKEILDLLT
jgi:hypothetical protein